MKEIPLIKGFSALVDDEDYPLVSEYGWFPRVRKHTVYVECNMFLEDGKRHTVNLHRFIMKPSSAQEIDHINHNGLDNRKSNLRVCLRAENAKNRSVNSNSTSGYKGVCLHRASNKWQAYIGCDKKFRYLGLFTTAEDAARAYDAAAIEGFGKFASPNFSNAEEEG